MASERRFHELTKDADKTEIERYGPIIMRLFTHDMWQEGPTLASSNLTASDAFNRFMIYQKVYDLRQLNPGPRFPQLPHNQYIVDLSRRPKTLKAGKPTTGLPSLGISHEDYRGKLLQLVPLSPATIQRRIAILNKIEDMLPDPCLAVNNNLDLDHPRVIQSEPDTAKVVMEDVLMEAAGVVTRLLRRVINTGTVTVQGQCADSKASGVRASSRLDHVFCYMDTLAPSERYKLVIAEEKMYGKLTKCDWAQLEAHTANGALPLEPDSEVIKVMPQMMKYYNDTGCRRAILTSSDITVTMTWSGSGTAADPYICEYEVIKDRNPMGEVVYLLENAIWDDVKNYAKVKQPVEIVPL